MRFDSKTICSALILSLSFLASAAQASSDFDQRAQLGAQNSEQAEFYRDLANLRKQDADFVSKLSRYGATHGGFASTPSCYSSFGDEDQNTSYQVCAAGLCVTKITDSEVSEQDASDPQLGIIKATETFILRCQANLGNGLACQFSESGERLERFDAYCLDAQGNPVKTTAPAAKTSRKPVAKKKK